MHSHRITALVILLTALLATGAAAGDERFAGRWSGTLDAGPVSLRLQLDVERGHAGELSGTLVSLDQSPEPIPCLITARGDTMRVEVESIRAGFTGVLAAGGESLSGVWHQGGRELPLEFARGGGDGQGEFGARVDDQPYGAALPGVWAGTLTVGVVELRLQLNVFETDGLLGVTLDSVDQGANGIPARIELADGRRITVTIASIGGRYDAELSADGDSLSGDWVQGPQTLDLVMTRSEAAITVNRPQEPVPPFPYEAEDVAFPGGADGVTLAGTLTLPRGEGPFPAAVLVSGSGPQNRDEELMNHKPFLVLADALTRRGIAVLRYDDRGTAESTGDFSAATSADFADDAEAALAFLKDRPGIDAGALGIVGHSEGGLIAPMVASRMPELAYIVMLAGPGVGGRDILRLQTRLMSEAAGETPENIEAALAVLEETFRILDAESDDEAAIAKILDVLRTTAEEIGEEASDEELRAEAGRLVTPWFRYFLSHDAPAENLRRVRCPVLALNGGLDLQVDPDQNLPVIRAALAEGGNERAEIRELPGLNHLFQTAETGALSEYAQIEETMAPVVLELVGDWILETVAGD